MSKYGLGGCDLPDKRVIGANLEPMTGLSQEKRGSEVGLIQGQALGLGHSSSMSIMIEMTYSP